MTFDEALTKIHTPPNNDYKYTDLLITMIFSKIGLLEPEWYDDLSSGDNVALRNAIWDYSVKDSMGSFP